MKDHITEENMWCAYSDFTKLMLNNNEHLFLAFQVHEVGLINSSALVTQKE